MIRQSLQFAAIAAFMMAPIYAQAQSGDAPTEKKVERERRSPPPEAFEACEGKSANDACSVTTKRGELEGTCKAPKDKKPVCVPKDRPQKGDHKKGDEGEKSERRGPPPEAFEACEGKAAGDVCSVTTKRGELEGTCKAPKDKKPVCAPKDRPHKGDRHGEANKPNDEGFTGHMNE